jgi:starvation-inducible outer membrane lipoprotein
MKIILGKVKVPQLLGGLLLSLSFLTGCATTPQQNHICSPVATGAALGITSSPNNPWKGANLGRWFPGDFVVISFGCE